MQPSNTWEEEADGRYWERREEKREVGWTLWTMDIGKTCLDQATFEVGAHNVREAEGSQAKTHKKYNIPLWVKTSCRF